MPFITVIGVLLGLVLVLQPTLLLLVLGAVGAVFVWIYVMTAIFWLLGKLGGKRF